MSLLQESTQHFFEKEKANREIKEGLIRACDIIDLIIEILRGSANLKMAKDCLVNGNVEGIKFKSEQSKSRLQVLILQRDRLVQY